MRCRLCGHDVDNIMGIAVFLLVLAFMLGAACYAHFGGVASSHIEMP
jgi:hypothetical protein